MATNIQLEILKAKRLPQKEFDPMPPSASVSLRSFLVSKPLSSVEAAPRLNPFQERFTVTDASHELDTRSCKHTCAPFFSEKLEVVVEDQDALKKPRGVPFQPLPPSLMGAANQATKGESVDGNIETRPAYLSMEITVFNHNEANEAGGEKVEGPRPMLFGVVNIPLPWIAAQAAGLAPPPIPAIIKEVPYNVCLSEERVDLVDASVVEDDPTITGPLLIVRFKAQPPPPQGDSSDPHADVMLLAEPKLDGTVELVRENSQYVWYNLLHDRKWQMNFTQQMLQQWPKLPKTVIGGLGASGRAGGSKQGGRSPPARRGSSVAPTGSGRVTSDRTPSYKSITDLMMRHWSVRRTHEALTKLRLCAERYQYGEDSLFFTVENEAAKKVEWRERQVLRLGLALKSLEGLTSTSPVRILLDKLWLNMVYNIRADNPNPPPISFEMKHKMQTVAFQQKHAKVLQACLLQLIVPGGMSFAEASAIAEEDLDPKNVQYVSHRSSLVGGEYVPTEGIMMAFGKPVEPCEPRPKRDIAPLEHIDRLLESTSQSLLRKSQTPAQRRAAMKELKEAEGTQRSSSNNGRNNNEGSEDVPDELPLIKRNGQQLFTTILVEFVGRLVDTMTDHEFMLILQAMIPAVCAAAEKCLMASGGVSSPTKKRGKSASKRKTSLKKAPKTTSGGAGAGGESGPIVIDHLDELGRRKPKAPPVAPAAPTTSSSVIEEE